MFRNKKQYKLSETTTDAEAVLVVRFPCSIFIFVFTVSKYHGQGGQGAVLQQAKHLEAHMNNCLNS